MNTQELFDRARALADEGRNAKACHLLRQVIDSDPGNGEAYFQLGLALNSRGRHREALVALEAAHEGGYSPAHVHCACGDVHLALEERAEAQNQFEMAGQADPKFVDAFLKLAALFADAAEFDEALERYDKALAVDPNCVGAHLGQAAAYTAQREYLAATKSLIPALELAPVDAEVHSSVHAVIADAQPQKPVIERIGTVIDSVVSKSPTIEAEVRSLWAIDLASAGQIDKAIQQYQLALRSAVSAGMPSNFSYFNLAYYVLNEADAISRIDEVQNLIKNLGDKFAASEWTIALFSFAYSYENARERAAEELIKLLIREPNRREIYDAIWQTITQPLSTDDLDLMKRAGREVDKTGSVEAETLWAETLYHLGQFDDAVHWLSRFDKKNMDSRLHRVLGLSLIHLDKLDTGLQELVKSLQPVRLAPELNEVADKLETALRQVANPESDIAKIQKLVNDSDDAGAMIAWADILIALGRDEAALDLAFTALARDPDHEPIYELIERCWERFKAYPMRIHATSRLIEERATGVGNLNWGRFLCHLDQQAVASDFLRRAAELFESATENVVELAAKTDAENLHKAGQAWLEVGEFERALELFERSVQAEPSYNQPYIDWAEAFDWHDKKKGFIAALRDTLDPDRLQDSESPDWESLRAMRDVNSKRITLFVQSLKTNCDNWWMFQWCGNRLFDQGRYDIARKIYKIPKELFQLDSGSTASVIADEGNALNQAGHFIRAIQRFDEAAKLRKHDFWMLTRKAFALEEIGQLAQARQTYQEAFAADEKPPSNFALAVQAYIDWARILTLDGKCEEALARLNEASECAEDGKKAPIEWIEFQRAITYSEMKNYADAISTYEQIIRKTLAQEEPDSVCATFSSHNIANMWDNQGRYSHGKQKWQDVCEDYAKNLAKELDNRNAYYCLYFSWASRRAGYSSAATKKLCMAASILNSRPSDYNFHLSMVRIYLDEKKKSRVNDDLSRIYWKTRQNYRMAEEILERRLETAKNPADLRQLGELHLLVGEYEKSETALVQAREAGEDSARLYGALGELSVHNRRYKAAIQYFRSSLNIDRDDLDRRAALAQAYLKSGDIENAETEFQNVLNVTRCHVDSLAGLGEVYLAMAERAGSSQTTRRDDFYRRAIDHFSEAIQICGSEDCPKIYIESEVAAHHYLLGYAKIQLYEDSRRELTNKDLVDEALGSFTKCHDLDKKNHKALRAIDRIKDEMRRSGPQTWIEKWGPRIVAGLAALIFVFAHIALIFGRPVWTETVSLTEAAIADLEATGLVANASEKLLPIKDIAFRNDELLLADIKVLLGAETMAKAKTVLLRKASRGTKFLEFETVEIHTYALLAFGALLFLIAGAYLPHLRSLRVGGFQLEKGASERIETVRSFGISR